MVTEHSLKTAGAVLEAWWQLADMLVAKYSDGYINLPDGTGHRSARGDRLPGRLA